jgi:hypothetical protein
MTFSGEIIKLLDDLSKRFGIAVDWSSKNVMPYLQDLSGRIVNYEIATSAVNIAVNILIAFLLYKLVRYVAVQFIEEDGFFYDVEELGIATFVISGVISLFVFFGTIVETFDIIEALTIPEKTIINFVQEEVDAFDND